MQTLAFHFTPDPAAVARAVSAHTDPSRVAWLFGPHNAPARVTIMHTITGRIQPKAKCGITALMAALYTVFPVPSYTCIADAEQQLGELIRAAANVPQPKRLPIYRRRALDISRARYACNLWNRLTSPSALRTDDEHARCRKAARRVRAILARSAYAHSIRETDHTGQIYIAE